MADHLRGEFVRLRPATAADSPELIRIRSTPEVMAHWRGVDLEKEFAADLTSDDEHLLTIEDAAGRIVGGISWYEEEEPDYRHAGMDVYLDPDVHGRGWGADAVRVVARFLIDDREHHRLIIDPAVHNAAAIHCYRKVGFRPVGVMRRYERGADGTWHDGLLMDLLAEELV